jgi:hypothetical protein
MFANSKSLAIASFKIIVSENTKMKFVKMMIAQFLNVLYDILESVDTFWTSNIVNLVCTADSVTKR